MSTKTICDFHTDEHGAITRKVTIDGEAFLIDACQGFVDHLKGYAVPQAELVTVAPAGVETTHPEKDIPAGFAKTAKPKKKTAASTAVAVRPVSVASRTARKSPQNHQCMFCPLVLTQSGFQAHMQTKHGFTTARAAMGPKCPLCNKAHGRLTNHAKEEHAPFTNGAQLFAEAVKQGDPHGIVAKRRKAAKNVVLS